MGNYKFRFADMMPNTWFYKLKNMSIGNKKGNRNTKSNILKKKQTNSATTSTIMHSPKQRQFSANFSNSRKSYYFTRDPIANFDTFYNSLSSPENKSQNFHNPPRKSAKQGLRNKPRKSSVLKQFSSNSSASGDYICRNFSLGSSVSDKKNLIQQSLKIDSRSDESLTTQSSNCVCKSNSDEKDIIIDFKIEKKIDLPPIITKPTTQNQNTLQNRASSKSEQNQIFTKTEQYQQKNSARKFTSNYSPGGGMRLRTKSPRIANITTSRKSVSSSSSSGVSRRNNIADSFAVVKSSFNPQKDFKESMMEMIVENNIRASKDLEELLACYLSMNSDEYHDLIIKVFKKIWFDLIDMQVN